jgi:hypothetical protein
MSIRSLKLREIKHSKVSMMNLGEGTEMTRLDPAIIRHQIENLLIQCPELAEDEVLRADMIEGETEAHEFLRTAEDKRREACVFIGALEALINEMCARRSRFRRREEAMRQIAFTVMETAGLRKIEMALATYSIRAGTPKVVITDETLIPENLCRVIVEPDKTKIRERLQSGSRVQGAVLSNPEPCLSIRTK